MSATRLRTASTTTAPHALSLKVLRLSRPTLATQNPLPKTDFGDGLDVDTRASLAYPGAHDTSFCFAPALTLPKAFGLAYVGQRFDCTLCVNNELPDATVEHIKVSAELQTPSTPTGIALELSTDTASEADEYALDAGKTLQFILGRELQEIGQHVLVVTVTYATDDSSAPTRSFRKLYQFVAQQLISIRSKISERKVAAGKLRQWIIEAQIENVGEDNVVLSSITLKADGDVEAASFVGDESEPAIMLKPQDIEQVMFVVTAQSQEEVKKRRLGQIHVAWSESMGDSGTVKTGWLLSKS